MPSFDGINLTALSESLPRTRKVNTLQIHHATTRSLAALRALMDPGGRRVSANDAMGNDGYVLRVVDPSRRPFTSASDFDNQCHTVEVCNTSLDPEWGISLACHLRLARMAVELFREGNLGSISRAHIIGHREVPGTYATACPGPSMDLDLIVTLARDLYENKKRRHGMSTLYGLLTDDGKPAGLYALGGDSPGTPANWLETYDYAGVALPWANAHGSALMLTPASFAAFKTWYLAPLASAAQVTVDSDALAQAVAGAVDTALQASLASIIAAIGDRPTEYVVTARGGAS